MSRWVLGGAALFREWSIKSFYEDHGGSWRVHKGYGESTRVMQCP